MKRSIGFVDYYISEWHANNYPTWIEQVCKESGFDFCVKYAWAENDVSPVDGVTTDEWCKKFGVIKCATIEELCEKSDYILVLSPSNPEKHLMYADRVLKFRKNTYIDKTFAPDYATAKTIFDIASKYGTPFFSSSALRYAAEIKGVKDVVSVSTVGGGNNFEEYVIHQAEQIIALFDDSPTAVTVDRFGEKGYICDAEFTGGKTAQMRYAPDRDFETLWTTADGKTCGGKIESDYFKSLIADILRFYESGDPSFDVNQTLDVIKLREGAIKGASALGKRIALD